MHIHMLEQECSFRTAVPVWPIGVENEMNITCGFYTAAGKPSGSAVLRIAAASVYRLFVNGQFICTGPVRTAHGFHRMDAVDITRLLDQDNNHIAIEVWNPFVNSFSLVKCPAFIQAELELDGVITAYTSPAGSSFTAVRLNQRVKKLQRFSFQRPFAESYHLTANDDLWRVGNFNGKVREPLVQTENKKLLCRGLPAHQYHFTSARTIVSGGTVQTGITPAELWKDRSLVEVSHIIQGYPESDLELHLTDEVQGFQFTREAVGGSLPQQLDSGRYLVLDMQTEKSGFLCTELTCTKPTVLWLLWDELLDNGTVNIKRLGTAATLRLELEPGAYAFQSFDVYSLKYLQLVCTQGCAQVQSAGLREYRYPLPTKTDSGSNDPVLEKIWQAALETFCQNSSDVFMDCPHRERGGWLCDSFFIGRVEHALTGESRMERQFLQNFLLPDHFEALPEGMLPMCYPSDHLDGVYIPNWAMWYVVELADYVARTGDRSLAVEAKKQVYDLIHFFRKYLNEFGLLEKLDSWVFVEWSRANDFVQDVNFPTNMLYARMLKDAGMLYSDSDLLAQAEKVRMAIRDLAYDGEFFVDNALRSANGMLTLTGERTETCQYYAFYFDVATPDTHPLLWERLTTQFGPHRVQEGRWLEIYPSNAFIGNYLRLELLVRYGLGSQTVQEMKGNFEYMADCTGTLWEHITTYASCNHGFASYYIYLLQQILK